jgi:uncharacterized SAM-binding protein YcdF (DUF218 family)
MEGWFGTALGVWFVGLASALAFDRAAFAGRVSAIVTNAFLTLIQPLGLSWLLLGSWVVWGLWRRRWRLVAVPGLAWLVLSLITCTPVASVLLARLEGKVPPVEIAALPVVDAIVCLGGGAEPSLVEPSGLHLKTGADRLSTALVLLAQGKAPVLVLGGGGYEQGGVMHSEADDVLRALATLGVDTSSLMSLGLCAHTRDEAIKVAELAKQRGWKKVLLVTSAYHLPRSIGAFEKEGVELVAVPCNYLSSVNRIGDLHWLHLPHSGGFLIFGTWFHEWLGTWVYRWRGWL